MTEPCWIPRGYLDEEVENPALKGAQGPFVCEYFLILLANILLRIPSLQITQFQIILLNHHGLSMVWGVQWALSNPIIHDFSIPVAAEGEIF